MPRLMTSLITDDKRKEAMPLEQDPVPLASVSQVAITTTTIPSLSWAFHRASPFGEQALTPARAKFRAAIVFAADDFVSPNHRAALQRFWRVLLARLQGELVLFTTDASGLPALLTAAPAEESPSSAVQVSEAERSAPLQLEGVIRLGVSGR